MATKQRQFPITFVPEMVKAAYKGRKNMFRQLIPGILPTYTLAKKPESYSQDEYAFVDMADPIGSYPIYAKSRYRVGDECWVKEIWAAHKNWDNYPPSKISKNAEIWFSDELGWDHDKHRGKIRSSRFMCKWMARRWLRITKVNDPERVNLISKEDYIAEGFENGPWVFPYVFEMIERPT